MIIEVFIPGEPVGKGRPRFSRKNGVAFTPAKTRSYEGIVRQFAAEKMGGKDPVESPIELRLEIYVSVPLSWPQWKKDLALHGTIRPTSRPDSDNVEKAIKDAMNQVVWRDDCQIVKCSVAKEYGSTPGVEVEIITMDNFYPCQITKRPANG